MKMISVEYKIVGSFVAALLLLLLASSLMYRSLVEYRDASRWVVQSYLVLQTIEEVRFGVKHLVSRQRTYFITDRELYLAEYKLVESEIRSAILRIATLTTGNPRQQLRIGEVLRLFEVRLKQMDSYGVLYRTKGLAAVRALIISGVADSNIAALEKQCDDMKDEELTLLKQRNDMVERNGRQALVVGALLVAVALAGLPLVWWRVRRTAQERQAAESQVEESQQLQRISDDLKREDTVNQAYGDILTLINQDWFNVNDMTAAALLQFNKHVSIMAGITYLVQEKGLVAISSLGIPLPEAIGDIALESMKRNDIVRLREIPADAMRNVSSGVGSVAPAEIIAVPLSMKNEIVAVVELASLCGFSVTDLRIINRIAPQLGFGIKQRRLEQVIKDRSTQLETANDELVTINEDSQNLNNALQISNEQLNLQKKEIADANVRLEGVSRS